MATHDEIRESFRQICRVPEEDHGQTVGLISWLYRPNDKKTNSFRGRTRLPLSKFSLLVLRPQWRHYRGRPVASTPLAVFMFSYNRLTGRVGIDALADEWCNPVVWDISVPRSARIGHQFVLGPDHNKTGCRSAVLLHRAVQAVAQHRLVTADMPGLPGFLFVFNAGNPPRMEHTAGLRAAVRELHPELGETPDEQLPDELLQEVFQSLLSREGSFLFAPQWLFAREAHERFAVHPLDGTPQPDSRAPEWAQVGNWVMIDGVWTPRAQEPADVLADLTDVLGRESGAAWSTLVEFGHMPPVPQDQATAACGDEEWAAFAQDTLPGLLAGDSPLVATWRRLAVAPGASNDAVIAAFADARRPYVFADESKVGVVQLAGYPSPTTMTWRGFGFEVDLFSVCPNWSYQIDPITPRDVDRLRRGLAIASPPPLQRQRVRSH